MICLVDEGKAVDVVCLDFIKAFDSPLRILLEKLAAKGSDRCALRWAKRWLDGQAQSVMVNRVKSSWRPVTLVVFLRDQYLGWPCLVSLLII